MPRQRCALLLALLLVSALATSPAWAGPRALFDNFHAEQAGNADWVIDNNQPEPVPAQSGIGPATARTYWTGAISSWGVDLVKRGYTVQTNNAAFTYGNASNPLDLSNFDVLIVPEPNTSFTASEVTAIFAFVANGGGLVAVGDHHVSDRNNDGVDSPMIWNALDPGHLLGVHWGTAGDANNNIVQTSTNVNPSLADSVTHGPEGVVTGLAFHNGTTFTLVPAANPTVRGEVWMNGTAQTSLTGVMAASAVYGNGRVFFVGDSSPIDDGSANSGNSSIYDGWGEAGATDSTLLMNATRWVTRRTVTADVTAPAVNLASPDGGEDWKAGSVHAITWTATDGVGVTGVDLAWSADGGATFPNVIATGLANSGSYSWTVPDAVGATRRVRVIARDAAGNAGRDSSTTAFAISRWAVAASAGAGGAISPSGVVTVAQGGSAAFTITPVAGWAVADVRVDGVGVGTPTTWTFDAVAANHTIAATFADAQAPVVQLLSPVGGEQWEVGSTHSVTWNASDNAGVDSLTVEWSANGVAGPWVMLAHGVANSGTWAWVLGATATDSALVRVTAFDAAGNAANASSAAAFRVVDPNVGAPTGGPAVLALSRPAPNPARGGIALRFSLPGSGEARLEVLDVTGRRVWMRSGDFAAGEHTLRWDGRDASGADVGAGLFFVRLGTPWGSRAERLVRVK